MVDKIVATFLSASINAIKFPSPITLNRDPTGKAAPFSIRRNPATPSYLKKNYSIRFKNSRASSDVPENIQ